MGRNWISLRIKLLKNLVYCKVEHLDPDILKRENIFQKVVMPYNRKSDKTPFKLLLSGSKDKAIAKGFEELLLESETYCHLNKKHKVFVIVTDIPDLVRGYTNRDGTFVFKTDKENYLVVVLPHPSLEPVENVYSSYIATYINDFYIAEKNSLKHVRDIISALSEIGDVFNASEQAKPGTMIPDNLLYCPELCVKDPKGKELLRIQYFMGESNIPFERDKLKNVVPASSNTPIDVSIPGHKRMVYNLLNITYLSKDICKADIARRSYILPTGVGGNVLICSPNADCLLFQDNKKNFYKKCVDNGNLGVFLSSLFKEDPILKSKIISLNRNELAIESTGSQPTRQKRGGEYRYSVAVEDDNYALFPLALESCNKLPDNVLDASIIKRNCLGTIGGIYLRVFGASRQDQFLHIEQEAGKHLGEHTLKEYISGKVLPEVFLKKFGIFLGGVKKLGSAEVHGEERLSQEHFMRDDMSIIL